MKRGNTNAKRKPLAVVVEPVVLRSCSICNWTNVSLINLGEPNKPRMVCQGCCKRAVDTMDEILALTQNPTLHRGGISLNETGGKYEQMGKI